MKKHLFALAAAAVTFAPAAMAQNYVFGAAGTSKVDLECEGAATCDTSGTAVKLGYGLDLGGWAVELGYAHFGKAKAADAGISASAKAQGLTVAAAWQLPMGNDWGLALRAGLGYIKTSISASVSGVGSGSDSDSNVAPLLGLGVNYALSRTTRLELGADFTKAEYEGEKINVRAVTFGVRHAF